ncbi:MAG TPA: YggT family protein [Firmicutes bacterium]|nr:YggT family protein [Bacillota bacterium]MDK2926378.1 YggT family protein [Bacillota bacterium]HHV57019.1 YggT family protein [Bacillota bacterium]
MFLYNVVARLFDLYNLLILIRLLLSWVNPDPYAPWVRFIYQLTEPFLEPFRRLLPPVGMIDFSPLLALLVLSFIRRLVLSLILNLVM